MNSATPGAPSDVDLVRAMQDGDVRCLGLLLTRHWAGMRAVALSIVGHGPDAEDALQDAALTAVRSIGDLRDPAAVGPWLRMVVRNACRMQVRRGTPVPVDQIDALAMPGLESDRRSWSTGVPCGTGYGVRWRSCRPPCAWW